MSASVNPVTKRFRNGSLFNQESKRRSDNNDTILGIKVIEFDVAKSHWRM